MVYPIFDSIANGIETELQQRNISTTHFKKWNEDTINATGLEIEIPISHVSNYLKALKINFDWDLFREKALARQLEGMEKHPLLQKEDNHVSGVNPVIDIEVLWQFDESETQEIVPSKVGRQRLDAASEWMDQVSKNVNILLSADDIITRWHFEVEGDEYGRYLSIIHLLSYFQYSFEGLNHLNEVHNYVNRRLQHLLYKINRVTKLADQTIKEVAA